MISPLPRSNNHTVVLAGAHISPAIRTDHYSDSDRVMDPDEQRDYADQGPPSDSDLDGDTQILATLLKLIPGASTQLTLSCCCKAFQCSRLW